MNQYRFTPQQQKGVKQMFKLISDDYKNHDKEFRKTTLLDWLKFLSKMETRKTYSDSNKTKLNEIRDFIMTSKLFPQRYQY